MGRSRYPAGMKERVLEWLAADPARTTGGAAAQFGVPKNTVKSWAKRARDAAPSSPPALHILPTPSQVSTSSQGLAHDLDPLLMEFLSSDPIVRQRALLREIWGTIIEARGQPQISPSGIATLLKQFTEEVGRYHVLVKEAERGDGLEELDEAEWMRHLRDKYANAPTAYLEPAVSEFLMRHNAEPGDLARFLRSIAG